MSNHSFRVPLTALLAAGLVVAGLAESTFADPPPAKKSGGSALDKLNALARKNQPLPDEIGNGDLARRFQSLPAEDRDRLRKQYEERERAARTLKEEQQQRRAAALHDVEKAATMPAGDLTFAAGAKDRRPRKSATTPVTTKEEAILKALDTAVAGSFQQARLEDVLEHFAKLSGQPIVIDFGALKGLDVTADTPVNFRAKGVSLRTALRYILGDLGLAYVIKGEMLQITTVEKARAEMVVRVHEATQLTIPIDGNDPFGILEQINAAILAEIIRTLVNPDSWIENGGHGVLTYYRPAHAFVIRQSVEFHATLSRGLMQQLRR